MVEERYPDLNRLYNITTPKAKEIGQKVVPDIWEQPAGSVIKEKIIKPALTGMGVIGGMPRTEATAKGWRAPFVPQTVTPTQIQPMRERPTEVGDFETYTAPPTVVPTLPQPIERRFSDLGVIETGTTPQGGPFYRTQEGVLSMEPETGRTIAGDRYAREVGIPSRIQGFERGIISEEENIAQLGLESRQRERGDVAMRQLETERAAGIVPPTGMAEYERNAARMRMSPEERILEAKGLEERKGEYVKGQQAVEKERLSIIPELAKTRSATALAQAKLGVTAADVSSKIQARRTAIEGSFLKTNLEQMKIQLSQTKNIQEQNKINREYRYKHLKDIKDDLLKSYETEAGGVVGPEYRNKVDNVLKRFQNDVALLEITYPDAGKVIDTPEDVWKDNPELKGKKWIAVQKPDGTIKWEIYKEATIVPER